MPHHGSPRSKVAHAVAVWPLAFTERAERDQRLGANGVEVSLTTLLLMDQSATLRPLVLVISNGEWVGRSFESVLHAQGYDVQRHTSGRSALAFARAIAPDAVVVDEQLADLSALEVTSSLRTELPLGRALPILVTSSSPPTSGERMALYAAGAWEYCSQPVDVDLLMLKLKTFVAARQEIGDLQEQSLIDMTTNMYSKRGLQRWSRELAARAVRRHEPFAAIAFETAVSTSRVMKGRVSVDATAQTRMVRFVSEQRRASDIVGHLGSGRFAVLAPDTDAKGASRLIERLQEAAAHSALVPEPPPGEVPLSVGYWAAADLAVAEVIDSDVVGLATTALSHIRESQRVSGVVRFDEIPT